MLFASFAPARCTPFAKSYVHYCICFVSGLIGFFMFKKFFSISLCALSASLVCALPCHADAQPSRIYRLDANSFRNQQVIKYLFLEWISDPIATLLGVAQDVIFDRKRLRIALRLAVVEAFNRCEVVLLLKFLTFDKTWISAAVNYYVKTADARNSEDNRECFAFSTSYSEVVNKILAVRQLGY